ncbi:hypothetical protein ACHAQH_004080 [Verticillium albo-atrum]
MRVIASCLAFLALFASAAWGCEFVDGLMVPGVAFALNPDYGTATVYFSNNTFTKVARIEDAMKCIGLRQVFPTTDAAISAVDVNKFKVWPKPAAHALLAVDYSTHGLDVALLSSDDGLKSIMRKSYLTRLGAAHQAEEGHFEAVKSVLAEISKPPFEKNGYGEKAPDEIRHLVLHGDAVGDSGFLNGLRDVLGDSLVDDAHAVEPEIAGAAGLAMFSHFELQMKYPEKKPAFGCRWRSGLHGRNAREL